MINIYKSKETDFTHNGIGVLSETIVCEIKRELNGLFYLELEYPLYDKKRLYLELKGLNIIKAPTPSGNQLFRIQKVEKRGNNRYVYATHIAFDLAQNFIPDTNIVGKNRLQAVQQILNNTMTPHNFKAIGNNTISQNNVRIVRKNPIQAIIGTEDNTILSRYGGEFDFDNFNINCLDMLGSDTGEVISYGKNLIDIKEDLNMDTVMTRCIPQGAEGLLLPEYYIDSPLVGAYYQPLIKHMKFESIKVKEADEEGPAVTREEALQILRDTVVKLYQNHIDEPFFNYTIEFANLSDTEEYKEFKRLIKYNLGDKIIIKHKDLNLHLHSRIIAYTYNSITKKYINIELGKVKKDINVVINSIVAQVEFTKQKIEMEVKNLDETLSTKIETTERGIKENINDTKEGLETKITKTAEGLSLEVDKKVNNVDFGTKIKTNYEAVRISWNTLSEYIEFKNGKLYAKQPDGSYFELGVNGIRKHTSSGDKDVHYLTWITSCETYASVSGIFYINLPAEFRGKDWSAYTSIYDTNNSGGANTAIQKAIAFTAVEDKANNRVGITGYTNVKSWDGGGLSTVGIGARVMVIA